MTTGEQQRYRELEFGVRSVLVRDAGDGVFYVKPDVELAPHVQRMTDKLVHWATVTPDATFMAQRERLADGSTGDWQRIRYAQMLDKARHIAQALVNRSLSAERPVVIVLLDSAGKMTRIGDANRIKRWMESASLATDRKPA